MDQDVEIGGLKFDGNKLDWSAIPLEVLEPLVACFEVGAKKYGHMNCLKPFENGDRRFFAAAMRHTVEAQHDPLAINVEDGEVYHAAQAAWNHLIRLYHARRAKHDTRSATKRILWQCEVGP